MDTTGPSERKRKLSLGNEAERNQDDHLPHGSSEDEYSGIKIRSRESDEIVSEGTDSRGAEDGKASLDEDLGSDQETSDEERHLDDEDSEDDFRDLDIDAEDSDPDIGHDDSEYTEDVLDYLLRLPQFHHEPLIDASQQIRLLKFISATQKDVIACSMEVFWAETAPHYSALSYVWGSSKQQKVISLNGYRYAVTKNCYYALSQVSRQCEEEVSYLWTDSICINQDDLDEKARQVQRMNLVYENASVVYSCVGKDKNNSQRLMETIQGFHAYVQKQKAIAECQTTLTWTMLKDYVFNHWRNTSDTDKAAYFTEFSLSFDWFTFRTYWKRLWIVQETWLAHRIDILCGWQRASIDAFTFVFQYLPRSKVFQPMRPGIGMCKTISYSRHLPNEGALCDFGITHSVPPSWRLSSGQPEISKFKMDMISALSNYRGQQCSNFRDRVYALQHVVAWPKDIVPLLPDYRIKPVRLFCDIVGRLDPFPDRGMTLFDELAESLPFLKLSCESSDLKELRRQRNRDMEMEGYSPISPSKKALISVRDVNGRPVICRIKRRENGLLTSDLRRLEVDFQEMYSDCIQGITDLIQLSKVGTSLYVDNVLVGRTSSQSREGDFLLKLPNPDKLPAPCWLVLRDSSTRGVLEIVGAAVIGTEWIPQRSDCHRGYTNQIPHLYMDPEDLLNLCYFTHVEYYYEDDWIDSCVTMRIARERFSSYVVVRE